MKAHELLCKLKETDISVENEELILSDIPKEVDITRKQAAIIIHNYLKKVLNEKDVADTTMAKELKDLYDCRVCVAHIEQVYCKGIMSALIDKVKAKESGLPIMFGGNALLTDDESDEIAVRVKNKSKRITLK